MIERIVQKKIERDLIVRDCAVKRAMMMLHDPEYHTRTQRHVPLHIMSSVAEYSDQPRHWHETELEAMHWIKTEGIVTYGAYRGPRRS